MLAKVESIDVLNTKEVNFDDVMYINSLNNNFNREHYRHGRDYYIDRDEYIYSMFIAVSDEWDLALRGECSLDVCRDTGLRGIKDHWLKEVCFRNVVSNQIHKPLVTKEEFDKIANWFNS